ncbi:hypothetical protein [Mesonia aestuariivivens]|uniref:Uncharacterized protein n=1 Tax=Mesonia aestuariivivens TaxID=2796128 RepID=A0ABS6W5G0_9FLAO|nr:hypothetical protein [Mesonia aestuariivivens]MBW2963108.1 hypothetical protein [Mesonia aestuariivivens]
MKTIFTVLMLFLTFNSFCQELSGQKSINKPSYSENSELKVFYSDKSSEFHSEQKPAAIFVNDKFVGSQEMLNFINQDKIETINIEKEIFEINGTEFYGKIYIKMKPDYNLKFLTLEELSAKYLELIENPIIYQIDEKVIKNRKNKILVDENFILKIVVENVKTSEKNTEINLIRLVTKTPENIKKANEIRIRGIEKIKPVANNGNRCSSLNF